MRCYINKNVGDLVVFTGNNKTIKEFSILLNQNDYMRIPTELYQILKEMSSDIRMLYLECQDEINIKEVIL